jgi:hypothetical protein
MRWFRLTGAPPNLLPHYNAAPGRDLPVIRLLPETGERALREETIPATYFRGTEDHEKFLPSHPLLFCGAQLSIKSFG